MKVFWLALFFVLPQIASAESFCGRLDMKGSGGIVAGELHDLRPSGEKRTLSIGEARIEPSAVFPENGRACVCLEGEIKDDGDKAAFLNLVAVKDRPESACAAEAL